MNSTLACKYPHGRILVFAKAPVAGEVKTRLAAGIGDEQAATLYARLVSATVRTAAGAALAPVELHVASAMDHPLFVALAREWSMELRAQRGADLGERMYNAMQDALSGSSFVILIGTDCPLMTADYLGRACRQLDRGIPVVLGPVEDGGYVLIGARCCDRRLFTGVPWSSGRVLQCTRERLRSLDLAFAELATLWDIDRPEDLERLQRDAQAARMI